jgi:hypothetical protein
MKNTEVSYVAHRCRCGASFEAGYADESIPFTAAAAVAAWERRHAAACEFMAAESAAQMARERQEDAERQEAKERRSAAGKAAREHRLRNAAAAPTKTVDDAWEDDDGEAMLAAIP